MYEFVVRHNRHPREREVIPDKSDAVFLVRGAKDSYGIQLQILKENNVDVLSSHDRCCAEIFTLGGMM